MKTKQRLLALVSLIMAAAIFSCTLEQPAAAELNSDALSRAAAESCPQSKSYCLTVDYSKECTGDGSIKSCSTPSGTYVEGTEIVVAAAPCQESKSYFTGWYDAPCGGKLVSTEETYRFKLNGNTALYARFDRGATNEYISFPDMELDRAIRKKIGNPEGRITQKEVAGIEVLNIDSYYLKSIAGIEHLKSLTKLHLPNSKLSDITQLKSLTNLTSLSLGIEQVQDIGALANLKSLTELTLNQGQNITLPL